MDAEIVAMTPPHRSAGCCMTANANSAVASCGASGEFLRLAGSRSFRCKLRGFARHLTCPSGNCFPRCACWCALARNSAVRTRYSCSLAPFGGLGRLWCWRAYPVHAVCWAALTDMLQRGAIASRVRATFRENRPCEILKAWRRTHATSNPFDLGRRSSATHNSWPPISYCQKNCTAAKTWHECRR